MATTAIDLLAPVHPLTVEQYDQMVEAGVFEQGPRVELIDGVLVEMSPMGEPHSQRHVAHARATAGLTSHTSSRMIPIHCL